MRQGTTSPAPRFRGFLLRGQFFLNEASGRHAGLCRESAERCGLPPLDSPPRCNRKCSRAGSQPALSSELSRFLPSCSPLGRSRFIPYPGIDQGSDILVVNQFSFSRRFQSLLNHRGEPPLFTQVGFHGFIQKIAAVTVHGFGYGIEFCDLFGGHSECDDPWGAHNTREYTVLHELSSTERLRAYFWLGPVLGRLAILKPPPP
jgi:hypothetical protein